MEALINRRTKNTLTKIVRENLSTALSSSETESTHLNQKTVAAISSMLVDQLILDVRFLDCVSEIVPPKNAEFLTTEDAARLSGFSRPFIIALLDGPLYAGTVTRTEKGHRRILRSEFVDWINAASGITDLPKTIEDVRSGPRDEGAIRKVESSEQKAARLAAKETTMANAKLKGML